MMNYFLIISVLLNITLGSFVWGKSRASKQVRISFLLITLSLAIWCFSAFMFWKSNNPILWARLMFFGPIILAPSFLHFSLWFNGPLFYVNKLKSYYFLPAFLFLSLTLTNIIVESVEPTTRNVVYGFGNTLFAFYFSACFLIAFVVLTKKALAGEGTDWQRYIFLIAGTGIPSLVGTTTNLVLPLLGNSSLNRVGPASTVLFVASLSYAILRHRLMDIEVIIRRTVIFAGLLAFVFGVFSAATFFVQELLTLLGAGKVWTYTISLFFIVLGYDPIRNFLINLTDKYLFQKKYDYQALLKDASRGMSRIESLNHLLALVTHFITMRMRIKNAAIMTRRKDNEFELGYQRGYTKNYLEYHLDDTNPMIIYLKREKEAIEMERIREYMEAGNRKKVKGDSPHTYDFQAIKLTMDELDAACVVPSFLGRELQNILILGEKKSSDYYTTEDLNVLFTLAQESAIAIENARLYDEAINKSKQLSKINEQLEYSRNLLMKALRETEVANKQLQDTQAQLIHEQKMATLGRLAASVGHEVNNPLTILSMNVSRAILKYRKNSDLKVGDVLELFQKMEQNIGRIKAVVNTLTGLLKKSEKGKFEPLSLKLILEETLPLVQFQTYLDNLTGTEVEFDIPGNIPLVRGDLERLQEVFLNLFINAYHAMAGRRNRRIRVTAEVDQTNTKNVAIHFSDNGSGMSEEVMKKIFNYGFTTKPPGRGSGMGLYMCKYIIELHGGDVKVQSQIGVGTTFTITLPAFEEIVGDTGQMSMKA